MSPGTGGNHPSAFGQKAKNIEVFVRVRPPSKAEEARKDKVVAEVLEDGRQVRVVDQGYGNTTTIRTFQFDGCLGPEVLQDQVMERCSLQRMLESVMEGYTSTVMACGQTGSGKTYTMCGRQEGGIEGELGYCSDDGLIARSVKYLFNSIKLEADRDPSKQYTMKASYYEIYNEQVNDLLRLESAPREIKWNVKCGYYVENLLLVECESVDDVFAVLNEGAKNRKMGTHNLNKDSSRSHCIMTLHVDSVCHMEEGPPVTKLGKILFVDLAGNERLKKSKSSGEMLKETGNINRSLFTLGKVISSLAEGKKGDVVPYRESMLTKLLMESLGGNSLALMIACISPAVTAVDETLSTLHYATCTKKIINVPTVNMDEKDKIILQLQKDISQLKQENKLLRTMLGVPPGEEMPADMLASSDDAMLLKQMELANDGLQADVVELEKIRMPAVKSTSEMFLPTNIN